MFCKQCGLSQYLPMSTESLHKATWFTYAKNKHSCWNKQATGACSSYESTALIYYKRRLLGHLPFFRSPYFLHIPNHPPSLICTPICVEADTNSGAAFQMLINREVWLPYDSKCGVKMSLINIWERMNLWYLQVIQQQKHSTSHCCSTDLI